MEVIGRFDELLERVSEADREKLSFAIRQTVKRITLRRERRQKHWYASHCGMGASNSAMTWA